MHLKLIERSRAALRAFWGSGDWVSTSAPGNVSSSSPRMHWVPNTVINWDAVTGDLWMCPAVQACLNWINRNFTQAAAIVETKVDGGRWQKEPDHPLIDLLNYPNPEYDGSVLLQSLITSLETNGNGYAIIERTRGGDVAELWYEPHNNIWPMTRPGGDTRLVDYYERGSQYGQREEIPVSDVLHLKYGLDPTDVRLGLSPLASAKRGVYTLQVAENYRANIMRNGGAVGAIFTGKTPDVQFDPQALVELYQNKQSGDNAGKAFAIEAPLDITFPRNSPEDMGMETFEDRPEATISGLIGIPPQVAGLHSGRLSKTYANVTQAREAAWEEKLIPMGTMISCQEGRKLLPEFSGTTDPVEKRAYLKQYRLAFDYDGVRQLQPDKDALHERVRRDWLAYLITLKDWKIAVGMVPDTGDENIRYSDFVSAQQVSATSLGVAAEGGQAANAAKSDWASRIISQIEALETR